MENTKSLRRLCSKINESLKSSERKQEACKGLVTSLPRQADNNFIDMIDATSFTYSHTYGSFPLFKKRSFRFENDEEKTKNETIVFKNVTLLIILKTIV